MNGDTFEIPMSRKNRSLSFSHSRFHRHSSSSDEDDQSPVRHDCYQNEFEDDYSRDSLSEFSRVTLNDHDKHRRGDPNDDFSAITRKRTFSSSEPNSADADSTTKSTEKRAATKICRVCGDKAYSYNFSVVTCESCKAFFRRNANKSKDIRCPFSDNCDINLVSRRFCQKCRLAKCFKVGMKKEWIMSEEARREKKQRIQDNRERRMAERAQEEQVQQQMAPPSVSNPIIEPSPTQIITNGIQMTPPSDPTIVQPIMGSSIGQQLAPLNSGILPNLPLAPAGDISTIIPPVVPSLVSVPPPVQSIMQSSMVTQPEPVTAMQQALQQVQQAQQVQNAQILAQVAMQNQSDAIATIQQAAQIASSINTTAVPAPTTNPIAAAANLNHLAQVAALQGPSDAMVSIQQAAQIASVQSPTTTASITNLNNLAHAAAQVQQQNLVHAAAQVQQQINANLAAQRIQASQNLADQQQLAAAVAVATAVANQPQIVQPTTEPMQQSIASAILPTIIPSQNPVASMPIAPTLVEPLPPPTNPNNEMITVRKDVLMGIVQENIENRQAQIQQQMNTPPVKCKCVCQCGRYGNDSVIVDKVMADMLHEAKTVAPVVSQHHESMDCSRSDADCCLLSDEDKMALNELEEADKIFWAAQAEFNSMDQNAADVALRKLIRMMTSLSCFNKFSRADQSNLLKHGCASHFICRSFLNGNRQVLSGEHSQNLMVTQFYNSLREEWRNNRQIMLLVSILVVFDPDAPNIENRAQIMQTCARLKSILKRMLYTIYQNSQKTIQEFDDLINKLNVLQNLNNTIPQNQNGVDSHRIWSAEILEPLLSRELFEPSMMISSAVNTISSMT